MFISPLNESGYIHSTLESFAAFCGHRGRPLFALKTLFYANTLDKEHKKCYNGTLLLKNNL
jgi:hypothetical protein